MGLFVIQKTKHSLKCPSTGEWVKKTCVTSINRILSAIKRNELIDTHNNVDEFQNNYAE